MGKIKAALAKVSTEFVLVDPGIYTFEVKKVAEVDRDGALVAYRISSEVVEAPDGLEENLGRVLSDYINLKTKEGDGFNEIGLAQLKRYFEVTHGADQVKSWTDEDYDTDLLINKRWRGQVTIDSYTKQGETEPRTNNKIKRMEPAA